MVETVGAWRVAVATGEARCGFEAVGWLEERSAALAGGRDDGRVATVEVRRTSGGLIPRAALSGRWEPGGSGELVVRVGHTGAMPAEPVHDWPGMLGAPTAIGLPEELAEAVLGGLVGFRPASDRGGRLTVAGGAFHEVDSSPHAFERAAWLLEWVLLGREGDAPALS